VFNTFGQNPGAISTMTCRGAVTVTLNVHLAVLPAESTAVLMTGVVPTGKIEPEAGTLVTVVGIEQLFTAVGAGNVTTADDSVEPTDTMMFEQLLIVITVLVKSGTRMHWENSEVLELLSLAVAVMNLLTRSEFANGRLNVAPPLRSVVTSADPKNV
jgi:hypothetical protein